MHILVIGGNGFIGSHFVAAAVDAGHRVTVVGQQSTNPVFPHGRPFEFRAGGIAGLAKSDALLKSTDIVCHFASSSTPASAEADPERDRRENFASISILLQAMRASGPSRLVYLSSGGAVYGAAKIIPIPETQPASPIGAYGATKLAAENLIAETCRQFALDYLIVRPSNPYGPGQIAKSGSGVIPAFLLAAESGQSVTLYGDGKIVRDFIYVADLAQFLLKAIESGATGIVNAGAGQGTSLLQLLDVVEAQIGKAIARKFAPARPFDPPEIVLDISKAYQLTGWRPVTILSDGIKRTFEAMA